MNQKIIYKTDEGTVALVSPTEQALASHTIEEIAIKDVPANKPFAIVDAADLPTEPQESWVIDDADLVDGIGGESNEFS
jgi:hypothetical protein